MASPQQQQQRRHLLADVPAKVDFPGEEQKIIAYWSSIKAFETSLKLSEGKPEFTFYDGPPFATGLPHFGHILAGTIKDTVTRYAHQTGHYVSRRFGWDCHGLPIEYEIDQIHNIKSREQVLEMGVGEYNKLCRGIVTRYTAEWESTVSRLGRWIDFKNDYKTMDPSFMESVWWVFSQMHTKNLVYRGYKVMPFSTACATPLSNFEAGLNYKDVHDPAVTVTFPLVDDPNVSLLAWTTTPWTLPSNLALCVNDNLLYTKIRDKKSSKVYILLKARLSQIYPEMKKKKWKPEKAVELFEVLEEMTGDKLVGLKYEPILPYFKHRQTLDNFRVLSDDYVTEEGGTGVVHQAPGFGEDDYRVCVGRGVLQKDEEVPCPVDANGRFTAEIPDFVGQHVKEADTAICAMLKQAGRLLIKDSYEHTYPFCWRSDTPLIYKVVPSLFVRVESIKDRLLACNDQTKWVPDFVKEKRFHNWLANARDWAISRNRFWGTPIPLWVSEDGKESVAISSIAQLEELSGEKVTDLHKENVDHIVIPSKEGRGDLRRVDEVFDCWFESGSMPYAQQHYPFENKERVEKGFPADFIAEGLDQTRGWFYTLMVVSTALFDKPAFKNVIVNGLVLAEDGKKMSKRLKNYPDPTTVVNKYGADSLRLYLINSNVVKAEPLRFKEAGVHGVVKDVLLPWFNAFRFFAQQVVRWETGTGKDFVPNAETANTSTNPLDCWINASLQGLVQCVHEEMGAYRLDTVTPRLVHFIEDLTNWYVRLNRKRLKGDDGDEEAYVGLCCLLEVLLSVTLLMAPFAPFFSEYVYQYLRKLLPAYSDPSAALDAPGKADSVHYVLLPAFDAAKLNEQAKQAEREVIAMQQIINIGRTARDKRNISLRTPVKEVVVVSQDETVLGGAEHLLGYIKAELNTWKVTLSREEDKWGELEAVPNTRLLGKRLQKALSSVCAEFKTLTGAEDGQQRIRDFLQSGSITVAGHELKGEDVVISRNFKGDPAVYEGGASEDLAVPVLVAIDCTRDERIASEQRAREFVSAVQLLRKSSGLQMGDAVEVFFAGGEAMEQSITAEANKALIKGTIFVTPVQLKALPEHAVELGRHSAAAGDEKVPLTIVLVKPCVLVKADTLADTCKQAGVDPKVTRMLLTGMDFHRLKEEAAPSVSFNLDGKDVTLTRGADYSFGLLQ